MKWCVSAERSSCSASSTKSTESETASVKMERRSARMSVARAASRSATQSRSRESHCWTRNADWNSSALGNGCTNNATHVHTNNSSRTHLPVKPNKHLRVKKDGTLRAHEEVNTLRFEREWRKRRRNTSELKHLIIKLIIM